MVMTPSHYQVRIWGWKFTIDGCRVGRRVAGD
jgi:hypothetical protein